MTPRKRKKIAEQQSRTREKLLQLFVCQEVNLQNQIKTQKNMNTKRSDLPSGTCLYSSARGRNRRTEWWVPDLVDYIIIIPCLKTDKHKNSQQVAKWTGHLRDSEIRVFTAWEFDFKALQRYFHYHCPFWIQCSIFLSWEKERNQEQTIKLGRNWALLVHGIFVPNDDDKPFRTPVWSYSFHVCCSWKVVVAAEF